MKASGSLKCFNHVLSLLLIKFNNAFNFPDPEPPIISIRYG